MTKGEHVTATSIGTGALVRGTFFCGGGEFVPGMIQRLKEKQGLAAFALLFGTSK
jgi:hypothetical protein